MYHTPILFGVWGRFTISHHFFMAVRDVLAIPGWLRIARLRCGTRTKIGHATHSLTTTPRVACRLYRYSHSLPNIVLDPLCSQYNTRQTEQHQVPHTLSCGHARAVSQRSVARMQRILSALRKALSSISIAQTPLRLFNGSHFNMGRRQCVDVTPTRCR